jgi:hypothetical protein
VNNIRAVRRVSKRTRVRMQTGLTERRASWRSRRARWTWTCARGRGLDKQRIG